MSAFATMALPGTVPTCGPGKDITPEMLFRNRSERQQYERILNSTGLDKPISIKKVEVRIFDLSDDKQRKAYEKLWAKLLVMVSTGSVVVEHSKDLVHRADGTSYWMKYVEYVEFDDASHNNGRNKQ